jgi:hypothetical protein
MTKNDLGYILGEFFPQTHPATLFENRTRIVPKEAKIKRESRIGTKSEREEKKGDRKKWSKSF